METPDRTRLVRGPDLGYLPCIAIVFPEDIGPFLLVRYEGSWFFVPKELVVDYTGNEDECPVKEHMQIAKRLPPEPFLTYMEAMVDEDEGYSVNFRSSGPRFDATGGE